MTAKMAITKDILCGEGAPLCLIAGPCVIESEEHLLWLAGEIKKICAELSMPYIFKASFTKANRSSGTAYRGPGLEAGLAMLAAVKEQHKLPICTDIHEPWQAEEVAKIADIIQIPAFLCRQTDLLEAAARTGKTVNIKKGQFMAPEDMGPAAAKVAAQGNNKILLTERGASFGYHNLVVDMRSFPIMKKLNYPVIYDGTHSLQLPGGLGGATGGLREYIPHLVRAAVAAGIDGLFLEVHEEPDRSPSDSSNIWPLDKLKALLEEALAIRKALKF